MATKVCTRCKVEKGLLMFDLKDIKKDRRQSRCKNCVSEVAKERGYSLYSKRQKDERLNRTMLGQCRVCKESALLNKRVCRKHYIVDVASKTLGVASSSIANELLKRFASNPHCPYTGELLVLGLNAHLDHILSLKNRPDLKGDINNVEWVSEIANLSKNGFNKDEFVEFCKIVAERYE